MQLVSLEASIGLFLVPLAAFAAALVPACPSKDSAVRDSNPAGDGSNWLCDCSSSAVCAYTNIGTINPRLTPDPRGSAEVAHAHILAKSESVVPIIPTLPTLSLPRISVPGISNLPTSSHIKIPASSVKTNSSPSFPSSSSSSIPPSSSSSPVPSSPSSTTNDSKLHRTDARPAVIAATVLSVGFLVGIVLIVLWMRKRRRLRTLQSHPEPYIDEEARLPQDSIGPRNHPNKERFDAATGSPSASDSIRAGSESVDEVRWNIRSEEGAPQNETLTQRMHRVEAQLEALLALGFPDSAPPSYRG
ncbi:hypothetical protein DFH06DRAFT_390707 [Mycena polygramma]|nr:hypothetical protein DFH06DRAFT_390707 [Mycena polygramma]